MTIHQKLSSVLVAASTVNLAFHPQFASAAFLTLFAIALYAFAVAVERREHAQLVAFEERIEKRIKELDEKVQNISLARGMGR